MIRHSYSKRFKENIIFFVQKAWQLSLALCCGFFSNLITAVLELWRRSRSIFRGWIPFNMSGLRPFCPFTKSGTVASTSFPARIWKIFMCIMCCTHLALPGPSSSRRAPGCLMWAPEADFRAYPLAILFPETEFLLVDSIGKKIKVVKEVADAIGLKNVQPAMPGPKILKENLTLWLAAPLQPCRLFVGWVKEKITPGGFNELPNGILYLKGGDF
jgi:hypothetical protein